MQDCWAVPTPWLGRKRAAVPVRAPGDTTFCAGLRLRRGGGRGRRDVFLALLAFRQCHFIVGVCGPL